MNTAIATIDDKDKPLIDKATLILEIEEGIKKEFIAGEIIETEDLYQILKTHIMAEMIGANTPQVNNSPRLGVRNNQAPKRSAMYLASQTSNLIAVKNLKFQMMKEQTRMIESKIEKKIKMLAALKDEKGNGEGITAKDVLNYLINEMNTPIPITGDTIDHGDIIENEMFDDELDKRLEEEALNSTEEVSKVEPTMDKNVFSSNEDGVIFDKYDIDGDNIKFVYKSNEDKIFLVDVDGNILEEVPEENIQLEINETDPDNVFIIELISNTIVEEI
jgi:hypothetical protein